MKCKIFTDETENKRFFTFVHRLDKTPNKQIEEFLRWCYEHGFMDYLSDADIDFCYEHDCIALPLFKKNHICIGMNISDDGTSAKVGIDPTRCFDKTSKCSIIAALPINSKRENKQFYKALDNLLDSNNYFTKEWFRNASTCWCGDYASFGI